MEMIFGGTDNFRLRLLRAGAALAAATAGALGMLALGAGVERAVAGGCPTADATIDDPAADLRKGITCLINDKRRDGGRHVLDPDRQLRSAATKHNKAMLRENCWEHQCPGEPSLGKRIHNSGYLNGAERWRYAQSIGCARTPDAMFDAWMATDSDFNRENIRNRVFRDIGVGVLKEQIGASGCDTGNEVTFTVLFARRWG